MMAPMADRKFAEKTKGKMLLSKICLLSFEFLLSKGHCHHRSPGALDPSKSGLMNKHIVKHIG
jgi:hypothetical protein